MNFKLMNGRLKSCLLWGGMAGLCLCFTKADDPTILRIVSQVLNFNAHCNFQKVYVKTDKDKYMTGETTWLKAFLVNAISHTSDISSNGIFIDLIGRNNKVFQRIILKNEMGFANGNILLEDSLPEGNYQLVAYTNWMKNFDEAYYYSKTIQVVNPEYVKYIDQAELNNIKHFNNDFRAAAIEKTIQFFPEGGYLVNGIQGRVAFKAINKIGNGVSVKGEIYDNLNNRVCRFESKHLGMGAFNFMPEKGKSYYAKAMFDEHTSMKVDLPTAKENGIFLMVNSTAGDLVRINLQVNIDVNASEKEKEFLIIAQSRGELRYASRVIYAGAAINTGIPKSQFPAGITQITVFDGNGTPLCERLIFIFPKDTPAGSIINVQKDTENGELVYKLKASDLEGRPVKGNVAVSLYENLGNDSLENWKDNILSSLLLTSDLKGKIENANTYFQKSNPAAAIHMDYVMMVNGWRRFVWEDLLAGKYPKISYMPSVWKNNNETALAELPPVAMAASAKAYPGILNDKYDKKIIRSNTAMRSKQNSVNDKDLSSSSVIVDQDNLGGYTDMIQYLKGKVAGVNVYDFCITIRGASSFYSDTNPLFLQDHMEIKFQDISRINIHDVASVEVLKGAEASIYGVRGANGVIIFHMRTVRENQKVRPEKKAAESGPRFLTFHEAREFYVPAYETWTRKLSDYKVPRQIYWNPNVVIDSTGKAVIHLKTASDMAHFKVSIEGIAADGSILMYEENQ
jgi:TonB-dependent SusC/RagA subfamily outer membrane receptor